MAHFIYGVAENTGKGFFTAEDRRNSSLEVILQTSGWLVTTLTALCG